MQNSDVPQAEKLGGAIRLLGSEILSTRNLSNHATLQRSLTLLRLFLERDKDPARALPVRVDRPADRTSGMLRLAIRLLFASLGGKEIIAPLATLCSLFGELPPLALANEPEDCTEAVWKVGS